MQIWSLWLIAGIVLLIIEMVTPGAFFFMCFGLGALITAGVMCFSVPAWVQWFVFVGCSTILVLVAKPLLQGLMKTAHRPSNVDELIGKEAIVLEKIRPHHPGTVKTGGEMWKADADEEILEQSLVVILKVEGTRLFVKKKGA